MGIFNEKQKDQGTLLNEFIDDGFACETVIKSTGRSGSEKAAATLLFGFAGFAAMSGKKKEKALGNIYMKEKGLRFIPDSEKYIEIRIPWADIIHVGAAKFSSIHENVYIYTNKDSTLVFKLKSDVAFFIKEVVESKCNLLKDDLEGWE